MSLGTILVIVLVVALLGGFGAPLFGGPYGYGWGHSGVGILGILLIIVVVLLLLGKL